MSSFPQPQTVGQPNLARNTVPAWKGALPPSHPQQVRQVTLKVSPAPGLAVFRHPPGPVTDPHMCQIQAVSQPSVQAAHQPSDTRLSQQMTFRPVKSSELPHPPPAISTTSFSFLAFPSDCEAKVTRPTTSMDVAGGDDQAVVLLVFDLTRSATDQGSESLASGGGGSGSSGYCVNVFYDSGKADFSTCSSGSPRFVESTTPTDGSVELVCAAVEEWALAAWNRDALIEQVRQPGGLLSCV